MVFLDGVSVQRLGRKMNKMSSLLAACEHVALSPHTNFLFKNHNIKSGIYDFLEISELERHSELVSPAALAAILKRAWLPFCYGLHLLWSRHRGLPVSTAACYPSIGDGQQQLRIPIGKA